MKITLGKLAIEGMEARTGGDAATGIEAALLHYAIRLDSSRPPVDVPSFLPEPRPAAAVELREAAVDPETERALAREARRQNASLEEIAAHAVMVYLAEHDALT